MAVMYLYSMHKLGSIETDYVTAGIKTVFTGMNSRGFMTSFRIFTELPRSETVLRRPLCESCYFR